MKIAITGGSGFIGTRLTAELLSLGHECVNVDIRDPEDPVDICDLAALLDKTVGCDAIYHLAAEHRDDVFPREKYYTVNVQGTRNVCAAAEANGIPRILFTSSFAVYGLNTGGPDENATPAPFNDYGQSKWDAEKVLMGWAEQNSSSVLTIVRPVVVFGENNRGNVYNLIKQMASGKFLMIGSGQNKKSMAYVGNVVAFLIHLLDNRTSGEIFNYADAPDFVMKDLVDLVQARLGRGGRLPVLPYGVGLLAGRLCDVAARLSGKTFPISAIRIQKFCADTTCNAQKAHGSGFTAPYSLTEGLTRFIDHDFGAAETDVSKAA